MLPLISVIIPVYNHAKALRKSLVSLGAQTYDNLEIIIINDGSNDNIDEVVTNFQRDHIVKYIVQPNQGASAARNKGFSLARGEYIIFWDADTIAPKIFLETLLHALATWPNASYAYCSYRFGLKLMCSREFSSEDLRHTNYIDTTSLIRRSALVDLSGPFDITLKRFQDWDLWLTLLAKNRIGVFVPSLIFKKITHGRLGMSQWWPRIFFNLPWQIPAVKNYLLAKRAVELKHDLLNKARR